MRVRWPKRVRSKSSRAWESDHVFHDGDQFFEAMEQAIANASKTIEFESYIFAHDRTGRRIFEALANAAKRGVEVRLIVDGIGSGGWARLYGKEAHESGIKFKVFHELPWERLGRNSAPSRGREKVLSLLMRINNRNHRKVCIVDHNSAFVGGINIADCESHFCSGPAAWRDTGALVQGEDVTVLLLSFEHIWRGPLRALSQRLKRNRRRPSSSELVRLNFARKQRRDNYLDLLVRAVRAQQRIWITNAYFVPDGSLLHVLTIAARSGVDVRVLVPKHSDVFFMPWVTSALRLGLLRGGIRIYEYIPSMLHAKTILIDDWGLVGSSNLNHRSLLHDLEADVVITGANSKKSLEEQFTLDLEKSEEITIESWQKMPWYQKWIGWVLLLFKYLM